MLQIPLFPIENDNLKSKLRVLERKQKEKNLIIFNLPENDLVRDDIAEKKKLVEYKRRLSEKGITSRVRGLRLLVNDHRYTLHDISENPAILEELGATQSKPPTREKLCHLNIRSLAAHYETFAQSALPNQFDIIALSETWLTSDMPSENYDLCSHKLERCDRPTRGGGARC
ncbi:hypothetical protein QE152_g30165 [Popillia japonica]|uniref:Uncharacterized protein n=1 Tax=Popillia japonica TaxID=7064 RepID=A0AAW1JEQ2_POPJA